MKTKYLTGALLGLFVCGCTPGSRVIDLPTQHLVLDTPVQVQPPGATIQTFSTDGKYYAAEISNGTTSILEVRTYDGRTVYRKVGDRDSSLDPLMFLANGRHLVCARTFQAQKDEIRMEFVLLDWQNGHLERLNAQILDLKDESTIAWILRCGLLTNSSHDLVFAGNSVIMASGKIVPLPDQLQYAGRGGDNTLVFQNKDGWVRFRRDGSMQGTSTKPKDAENPTVTRGEMTLEIETDDVEHSGVKANVVTLWLTHKGASTDNGAVGSAVVGVGYDMGDFGFVPGHDAVYFQASDSFYVVPYRFEERRAQE